MLQKQVFRPASACRVTCRYSQIPPTSARHIATSSLAGKTCIISGASRGIGASIAQRLAAEGASCTLIGRHQSALDELAASLPAAAARARLSPHVRHQVRVGDVAERAFWERIAAEMRDVDILVNAAGITHYSLLMSTKPELVQQVVQTNLMGTIWACQLLVKNMMRRKKGCIINVSSLLGAKGGKGNTVYAASKAGVIGLTRSLAAEIGTAGIRVNAIIPGYIKTQMTDAMTPEARTQALNAIPLKRFGTVEEIADAAVFLCNNEYASNCVLNLDGALSAT
ncbi:MAG: hypothetical protein M1818_001821 [Claussenomyces sp. TS43310]|nr:MAG: hypothetical protein M1818_001821 [Claussenomyces sp. TS43310]